MMAQPKTIALVTKLTSHRDHGGAGVGAGHSHAFRAFRAHFVEVVERDNEEFVLRLVALLDLLVCDVESCSAASAAG